MLYSELGYSSLWSFCTEYLKLSEGSAQRRIAAMRLGRQVSTAKTAIEDGTLSLSNAAKLESFFKQEKKSGRSKTLQQKEAILQNIKGLSQVDCEKKLFTISPGFELSQKETLKPISSDQNILKVILDSEIVIQLKALKDQLAHTLPNASYADLIGFLVSDKLAQLKKKNSIKEASNAKTLSNANANANASASSSTSTAAAKVIMPNSTKLTFFKRKAILAKPRKALWQRSGGKCEYIALDGKRCESSYALEVDHIQSVASGGGHEFSNLRLVCRSHNHFFALQEFGGSYMAHYLSQVQR